MFEIRLFGWGVCFGHCRLAALSCRDTFFFEENFLSRIVFERIPRYTFVISDGSITINVRKHVLNTIFFFSVSSVHPLVLSINPQTIPVSRNDSIFQTGNFFLGIPPPPRGYATDRSNNNCVSFKFK